MSKWPEHMRTFVFYLNNEFTCPLLNLTDQKQWNLFQLSSFLKKSININLITIMKGLFKMSIVIDPEPSDESLEESKTNEDLKETVEALLNS